MTTYAQYPGDPTAVFPSSEEGSWNDVPFNAANFTGQAGAAWTVAPANVTSNRYCRVGNLVVWSVYLTGTNVSAAGLNLVMYGPTPLRKPCSVMGAANNPVPNTAVTIKGTPNGANPGFFGIGLANNASFAINAATQLYFTIMYE